MKSMIRVFLAIIAALLTTSCGSDEDNVAREISKWERDGWRYEETVGTSRPDAVYTSHMESETARSITAFSNTNNGNRDSKKFSQQSKQYLVVSMSHEAHGMFSLVFSKAKP